MFFNELAKDILRPNNPVTALVGLQLSNKIKEGVETSIDLEIQTNKIELSGKKAVAKLQERQYEEMLSLSDKRLEVEEAALEAKKTEAFATRYNALRDTYVADCRAFGEKPSRDGLKSYIESQGS